MNWVVALKRYFAKISLKIKKMVLVYHPQYLSALRVLYKKIMLNNFQECCDCCLLAKDLLSRDEECTAPKGFSAACLTSFNRCCKNEEGIKPPVQNISMLDHRLNMHVYKSLCPGLVGLSLSSFLTWQSKHKSKGPFGSVPVSTHMLDHFPPPIPLHYFRKFF